MTKDTQFKKGQSGNPQGRPKGSRNKLCTDFIDALANDFSLHGADVIEKLRQKKPEAYIAAISKLVPRELDVQSDYKQPPTHIRLVGPDLSTLTDTQLEALEAVHLANPDFGSDTLAEGLK